MKHACVRLAMAVFVALSLLAYGQESAGDETADRVRHFAVICSGLSGGAPYRGWYEEVNEKMADVLSHYGYPEGAVFRLTEFGVCQGPGIDGRSTLANLRHVFALLNNLLKADDHLFLFLIGHGAASDGDYVYQLMGGDFTTGDLKRLLDALPTRNATIAIHPCHSGGFLPAASNVGHVVVTSTAADELNGVPWAEAFIGAFSARIEARPKGPIDVSIKQAYNASLMPARRKYGLELREHPLLDDNGDGVGHFGDLPIVGGDGELASRRFLGDSGRKLNASRTALDRLRQSDLRVAPRDQRRLVEVFVAESVFLAKIGGYENDPGANLTDPVAHQSWAEEKVPWVISANLVQKYLEQFDRQAALGKHALEQFFGNSSAQMATHGIDLGNPGANKPEAAEHRSWAARQSIERLRDEVETKVRMVLAGALEAPAP
ncbi:MAG: C13 family peptidase [Planctomycetota bacterium]